MYSPPSSCQWTDCTVECWQTMCLCFATRADSYHVSVMKRPLSQKGPNIWLQQVISVLHVLSYTWPSDLHAFLMQLITSPSEENNIYVQQRDEYLESVCEMAIRKLSIITIFGTMSNSTMKIDHYQIGKSFCFSAWTDWSFF